MAIANSDGSIILSTKVDTSGMERGAKSLKSQAAKLAAEYRKAGMSQSEAFKKAWGEIERTKVSTDKVTVSTKKFGQQSQTTGTQASAAIAKIGLGLKSLLTYFIGIQTVFAAIRFSGASAELATQTEASVQRLVDIYGLASDSVGDFIDANARALGMSKAAAASFSSVYGNLFSVWADQATNAELTNRYLNMTAVVASKTGRTVEDVQERVRSGLLGNTEAIEDLGIFVNVKTIEMTDAFQRMAGGKSWEQLDAYTQQQIRSMAILEQATAKYGDEVADTSATIRNRYKAAYEDFQNSWGNIVNTVLLPVLETLTQIFDIATKGLNALSGRSGQILEDAEGLTDNSEETADNIKKQADNQKDLNDQMKKTLAGFDDIQILSEGTAETTQPPPDFDNITGGGGTAPDGSAYVEEINKTLTAIMAVLAVSMIAIGLILLFTGNIAWGLGTIIFGVALEGVTMAAASQTDFGQDIIQAILTIQAVASGALLAIGIMLCFLLGPSPVTIGLIVAGSLLLIESVGMLVGLNPNDIATWLSIITGIAGGAMLALGIILCMVGSIPVGVGLIIAGAISLVSAVALNFDAVVKAIQGPLGAIMAIVGTAMLVIGIILVCTGVGIPIGIALIAAGAVALVTPIALNWDAIWGAITGTFNAIIDWIKTYGLLVLGIILCLTGTGISLGIALIIKWAKDGAENGVPLATAIVDKVKETWAAVKDFWDKNIAPVFTLKWWKNLAINCGNGLIAGFEAAINGIIKAFESMINWIVDGLNKIAFDIPAWLGGGHFGINISKASLGRVSIPRLAQGTVIPPNREFLAVLGDNKRENEIVSPVSTMKQAFMEAMVEMGGAGQTTKEEHYYLDEQRLMSIIYRLSKGGERISGTSLVDGGAY